MDQSCAEPRGRSWTQRARLPSSQSVRDPLCPLWTEAGGQWSLKDQWCWGHFKALPPHASSRGTETSWRAVALNDSLHLDLFHRQHVSQAHAIAV